MSEIITVEDEGRCITIEDEDFITAANNLRKV